jgi:hypothetical protein
MEISMAVRVGRAATRGRDEVNFTELGEILRLPKESARRLCVTEGLIPYRKLGKKTYRVKRSDAIRYRDSVTTGTFPPIQADKKAFKDAVKEVFKSEIIKAVKETHK